MKVTLSEINKNLRGINSGVHEAKIQINDLEHKEEKQPMKTTRKKNPKKRGQCEQPLGQLQEVQHSHPRGAKRRKERARSWKSI